MLFPGGYQLGDLDGNVDLRAQAMNSTGVTFSWNTTGPDPRDTITTSGTGNYDLTFTWDQRLAAAVDSVTVTATNASSQQETQTYYFVVPTGNGQHHDRQQHDWPQSLAPTRSAPMPPSGASDGVSVNANSGALDATIPLPQLQPECPALALTYDSLTANPRPIIVGQPHPRPEPGGRRARSAPR